MRRALLLTPLLLLLPAACSDDDDAGADPVATPGDVGRVTARIEPTEGILLEGFEAALRFETADGEVLGQVLWSEFVAGQGPNVPVDAYDDSVYEQEVPAGTVVVRGKVTIGIGPGPEPIDPAGDLPCAVEVDVPAGGEAAVELALTTDPTCLRVL